MIRTLPFKNLYECLYQKHPLFSSPNILLNVPPPQKKKKNNLSNQHQPQPTPPLLCVSTGEWLVTQVGDLGLQDGDDLTVVCRQAMLLASSRARCFTLLRSDGSVLRWGLRGDLADLTAVSVGRLLSGGLGWGLGWGFRDGPLWCIY